MDYAANFRKSSKTGTLSMLKVKFCARTVLVSRLIIMLGESEKDSNF